MHLVTTIHHIKPILKFSSKLHTIRPELYLGSSILLETACTICLPKTSFNKLWFIPIYSGYGISFYLFPKCLNKYNLNVAYSIWCGFGIITTFLFDIILKKDIFTLKKVLGIFLMIQSIFLIK